MSSYFKAVELKGLHIYPSTTNNTTNVSRNYHAIAGMQSSRSLQFFFILSISTILAQQGKCV